MFFFFCILFTYLWEWRSIQIDDLSVQNRTSISPRAMKRKKNKLRLVLFWLRAFIGQIWFLHVPQNFLNLVLKLEVVEEFPLRHLRPLARPGTRRNIKRILKTPAIIYAFFHYAFIVLYQDCHFQLRRGWRFPSQIFLSGSVRPLLVIGMKRNCGDFCACP